MKRLKNASWGTSLCIAMLTLLPASVAAQGSLTGLVVDGDGAPMAGVQISLDGTTIGTTTQDNGRYLIQNVPAGNYNVTATRIGFARRTQTNIRVQDGERTELDFRLTSAALSLQELRVSGTIDPLEGIKAPFTVGRVSAENMQVPQAGSVLNSLSGKVAGVSVVTGGQPGAPTNIFLRTPTSVTRSNTPMYVVDGVILSTTLGNETTVDIEALDIESVEVIKGASAATLYGSRAAAGVIVITTKRGGSLELDQTEITARTEVGFSDLGSRMETSSHHGFLTNEAGQFIDDQGEVITQRAGRVEDTTDFGPGQALYDNVYGNPLHDNLSALFRPGIFNISSVSVGQNSASTNFFAAFTRNKQSGSVGNNEGFIRNTFRVNVDHRIRDNLNVALSTSHTRGTQDDLTGGAFENILELEPDVDIEVRDENGQFLQQPDPSAEFENPLWILNNGEDSFDKRTRTLASIDSRWTPAPWLRVQANYSYDRSEFFDEGFTPLGIPDLTGDDASDGSLRRNNTTTQTLNGGMNVTFIKDFGELNTRTTFRGIFEDEKSVFVGATATDFIIGGVVDLELGTEQSTNSDVQRIKSEGYLVDLGLDYDGKYIGDFVVRRDGSSLFGPDDRWQTYFRASGSYLISEEEFWPWESFTDFKFRAAIGTAGGRPNFRDQFEILNVSNTTGAFQKNTLGNSALAPEKTTEIDVGVDFIINDKYSVQLSYVTQETVDQIITLPLSAVAGFGSQIVNAGDVEGTTYEATLEAAFINTPDVSWNTTLVADRSSAEITNWERSVQSFGRLGLRCTGCDLYTAYGLGFLEGLGDVSKAAPAVQDAINSAPDQFQVNDDGYLVWVGSGGNFTDQNWGTTGDVNGVNFVWGNPIETDFTVRDNVIGDYAPDVTLGWLNNFRYKGLNVHTQFRAMIGGDINDDEVQNLYFFQRALDNDQFGKPLDLAKPSTYYFALYRGGQDNLNFMEDATFLKLQTLSVNYTLRDAQVQRLGLDRIGADQISLGVVGRNLFTITGYNGFDPDDGSGSTQRVSSRGSFPNLRQVTASVQIVF